MSFAPAILSTTRNENRATARSTARKKMKFVVARLDMLRRVDPVRIVQILANTRCTTLWHSWNRALLHSHLASTILALGTRQRCTSPGYLAPSWQRFQIVDGGRNSAICTQDAWLALPLQAIRVRVIQKFRAGFAVRGCLPIRVGTCCLFLFAILPRSHFCSKTPRAHPETVQVCREYTIQDFWGHHAFPSHRYRRIWRPQIWSFRRFDKPSIS